MLCSNNITVVKLESTQLGQSSIHLLDIRPIQTNSTWVYNCERERIQVHSHYSECIFNLSLSHRKQESLSRDCRCRRHRGCQQVSVRLFFRGGGSFLFNINTAAMTHDFLCIVSMNQQHGYEINRTFFSVRNRRCDVRAYKDGQMRVSLVT